MLDTDADGCTGTSVRTCLSTTSSSAPGSRLWMRGVTRWGRISRSRYIRGRWGILRDRGILEIKFLGDFLIAGMQGDGRRCRRSTSGESEGVGMPAIVMAMVEVRDRCS
jgi:hypothetical protein